MPLRDTLTDVSVTEATSPLTMLASAAFVAQLLVKWMSTLDELCRNKEVSNSTREQLLVPQSWVSGWIGWSCSRHCTGSN